MKVIENILNSGINNRYTTSLLTENTVFFDIETTGFSPSTSSIYLIGYAYLNDNFIHVTQLLAESVEDEQNLLQEFVEHLRAQTKIITFNGIGFDIPFIEAKLKKYEMHNPFTTLACIDIFKEISKIKHLLCLENYKQKTIEQFLNLNRNDEYSGGELICVYKEYLKKTSKECEDLLLLHNYEDVLGMLNIIPILTYIDFFESKKEISSYFVNEYLDIDQNLKKEIIFVLDYSYLFPIDLTFEFDHIFIRFSCNQVQIKVPIYHTELCYFYPNYKDYYYLPQEDTAIHKSVASFVDRDFREQAKAYNCYTRKFGDFLPQYESVFTPCFKKEYKDKKCFFEYKETTFQTEDIDQYILHILSIIRSPKNRKQFLNI